MQKQVVLNLFVIKGGTMSCLGTRSLADLSPSGVGIGYHISLRRLCRGGRLKQQKIQVYVCDETAYLLNAASVPPTKQTTATATQKAFGRKCFQAKCWQALTFTLQIIVPGNAFN